MILIQRHILRDITPKPLQEPIQYIEYSVRYYGQPKLKKPKELKNIKSQFSVDYIHKHCKCQIFIRDNDVWIKHRDYFSPCMPETDEDFGTPLVCRMEKYMKKTRKKEFVYPDCWSSIVLRNEAWICLKNLMIHLDDFLPDLRWKITRQQEKVCNFEELELEDSDMQKFWENLILELGKYKNAYKRCKENKVW